MEAAADAATAITDDQVPWHGASLTTRKVFEDAKLTLQARRHASPRALDAAVLRHARASRGAPPRGRGAAAAQRPVRGDAEAGPAEPAAGAADSLVGAL